MKKYISSIILNNHPKNFEEFVQFVYFIFQSKIDSIKNNNIKNKYIKTRKSILQYSVANKKAIVNEIRKNIK